jgi:DNA-binding NtrC family response regulator
MTQKLLIIDDDRATCEVLETELSSRGFQVVWATEPMDALARIEHEDFGLVITDLNMRQLNGADLCKQILGLREGLPVIVMTAFGSMEAAVSAIRAGAYDFVTKPFNVDDLVLAIDRGLQDRALREEVKRLRKALDGASSFDDMVGASAPMQKVYDLVTRVSETDTTVLITGESGTGKELVARAIHTRSSRTGGPFIATNCAAMPEPLLESELFGHLKGSFTDARTTRPGLFVKARKGTLFLDEIGDTPLTMQAKLLRALQERTIRPVGGDEEVPTDVRIIAATNHDLETAVEERRFREDLFYRINVLRIHVPPLRARGNDVLLLAQHFIDRYAAQGGRHVVGLMSGAAEKLTAYPWPGNVRELQNCIERAVALARFEKIVVDDLPEKIRDYASRRVVVDSNDPSELLPIAEVEHRYILRVLDAVGGNKTLAADVLGIDRRTLYRKLERAATEPPSSARWKAAAGGAPGEGAVSEERDMRPHGPISEVGSSDKTGGR